MSYIPRMLPWSAAVLFWLVSPTPSPAAKPPAESKATPLKKADGKFVRLQFDADKQPVALETAIVHYVPASGESKLVVDLVSVVHIGDREYYKQLNKQLDKYDVVLYELVAPPGTRIPKGGKRDSKNPIALLQTLMKTVLRLESQTEQIDYTRKHFVHADLSPEQMAEAMHKRGENGLTLALGIAADLIRQQNLQQMKKAQKPAPGDDLDPLALLLDPQGAVKLKRVMARQLAAMESGDAAGLGQTLNNLLIVDRNKAALRVFQKELAKGRKRIAIFYGAGHMPDFERRLLADFGLRRQGEHWLRAWDLHESSNGLEDLLKLFDP
jgi:hypothetical protein